MRGFLWFALVFLMFLFSKEAKTQTFKIDTVYLHSGDKITGEMLSLDRGSLKLKTDDAGTLSIKWINIDSLCVLNPVRILKHNGGILYGRLYPSGKRQVCILQDENNETSELELQSVAELIQIRKRFIDRITGTISAGYRFTKATNISQLDFAGNAEYKGEKSIIAANYSVVFTDDGTDKTQRQSGGAAYDRLLPNNWSVNGKIMAESNSEFKLDIRTSINTGASYGFISTSKHELRTFAGVSINREFSGQLTQNNLEGIAGVSYSVFILNTPKVTFDTDSYLIPSFTVPGRLRSTINADLNWEIFNDFYLKWNLFFSSDNKPLSGVDTRNDWGTSFGIEFRFN